MLKIWRRWQEWWEDLRMSDEYQESLVETKRAWAKLDRALREIERQLEEKAR